MRALYPNLITVKTSIGNSLGGRPIYMVKISDNPDVDENEPELLLNALHHAREPIGLSQLIFFMWHVLENYNSDKEIRTLLNSSELYLVPCVNPDGYVYNQSTNPNGGGMWRKNRRANAGGSFGVDLNRNYSFNFGIDNSGSSPTPSSDTYRGTAAFSEPETVALRNFIDQHQFVTANNYHSYGNYCLYPYDSQNPNNNPEITTCRAASTYLTAENGFRIGNSYETVGYKANGTTLDYEFGERVAKSKIYGFTTEVGTSSDGFWPASSRIIPICNSTIEMNRKTLRISTYYGRATPTGSNVVAQPSGTLRYQFQNFSIKPASYTVTASSLSAAVTAVGPAKTHSGLALLQTTPDSITFTVAANTPTGTSLPFELTVDNGLSAIKDTVTLIYSPSSSCGTPTSLAATNLSETGTTLSWSAVAGISSYALSVKPQSATTWPADITVNATSYGLTGLAPGTNYDWRVKAPCGTYATASFQTSLQTACFNESGGVVVFEAESYRTAVAGTGAAAGRSWTPLNVSTASGGRAMTITGVNLNVQNSLVGPRLDYALNFATTGTYNVWVRMAAGADGVYDDSFHLGLDGTAVTLNPNSPNYNNGSTAWTWIKAAGSTAFRVVVSTPGSHTLNLWMREDGVRVDKFVMTTSSSYVPSETGPAISGPCGTSPVTTASSRVAAEFSGELEAELQVVAYPNPFEQSVTVKVNLNGRSSSLRLIGANGRTYQRATIPATDAERTIQTGTLPSGAYFLEVIRDNERKVVPVRKQ
ncbi:M14 family zinc carboxypeptidase [Spirosoma arcticum]